MAIGNVDSFTSVVPNTCAWEQPVAQIGIGATVAWTVLRGLSNVNKQHLARSTMYIAALQGIHGLNVGDLVYSISDSKFYFQKHN